MIDDKSGARAGPGALTAETGIRLDRNVAAIEPRWIVGAVRLVNICTISMLLAGLSEPAPHQSRDAIRATATRERVGSGAFWRAFRRHRMRIHWTDAPGPRSRASYA
jgi:hypothetical protein